MYNSEEWHKDQIIYEARLGEFSKVIGHLRQITTLLPSEYASLLLVGEMKESGELISYLKGERKEIYSEYIEHELFNEEGLYVESINLCIEEQNPSYRRLCIYVGGEPRMGHFSYAIDHCKYHFLLAFKKFWVYGLRPSEDVLGMLIKSLGRVESIEEGYPYEAKLLLAREAIPTMDYKLCLKVIKVIRKTFIREQEEPKNAFLHILSPLKVCLLLIEIVKVVKSKYDSIECGEIVEEIVKIGMEDNRRIAKYVDMESRLLEKDLNNRPVISLMHSLGVEGLFENSLIREVLMNSWESNIQNFSVLETSSLYKLICGLGPPLTLRSTLRDIYAPSPHIWCFNLWIHSPKAKYFSNFMLEVLLSVLYIMLGGHTIKLIKTSPPDCTHYNPNAHHPRIAHALYWIHLMFSIIIIYFGTTIHILFKYIYMRQTNTKVSLISYETIKHILITILMLLLTVTYSVADSQAENDCDFLNVIMTYNFDLQIAIFLFLLLLGLILRLQIIETFGTIFITFPTIFKQIFGFLLIVGLETLAFACVGYTVFTTCEMFDSTMMSFLTLLKALFYDFSFTPQNHDGSACYSPDKTPWRYYASYIYMLIFLVLNIMVGLNFMVALIYDIISRTRAKAKNLYYGELGGRIHVEGGGHPLHGYTGEIRECSSALISTIFPYSLLLSPLLVLQLLLPRGPGRDLNKAILFLQYIPIMLLITALHLLCNLLLLPLSYGYLILRLVLPLVRGRKERKRLYIRALLLSLFGLLVILLWVILDTFYFLRGLFISHALLTPKMNKKPKLFSMSREKYSALIHYLHKEETYISLTSCLREITHILGRDRETEDLLETEGSRGMDSMPIELPHYSHISEPSSLRLLNVNLEEEEEEWEMGHKESQLHQLIRKLAVLRLNTHGQSLLSVHAPQLKLFLQNSKLYWDMECLYQHINMNQANILYFGFVALSSHTLSLNSTPKQTPLPPQDHLKQIIHKAKAKLENALVQI